MAGGRRQTGRVSRETPPPLRLLPGGRRPREAGPSDRDLERNAHWNEMLSLAETAWCWRDPESIDALAEVVAELRSAVHREWSR